jgi:hypothetical protein
VRKKCSRRSAQEQEEDRFLRDVAAKRHIEFPHPAGKKMVRAQEADPHQLRQSTFFTDAAFLPVWTLLSLDEEPAAHEPLRPDGKQAAHVARLQAGTLPVAEVPAGRAP